MRWNKENKYRLYELVDLKFHSVADQTISLDPDASEEQFIADRRIRIQQFFSEFGIEFVTYPSRKKNRVVIVNPLFGCRPVGGPESGVSIPEDVAEKFLILGVP